MPKKLIICADGTRNQEDETNQSHESVAKRFMERAGEPWAESFAGALKS